MVSFKELVAQDIALFLNEEEFAEPVTIDGHSVTAVLDQVMDSKHPLAYAEGVSLVTHVLFVSEAEIGQVPEQNQRMKINDMRYQVNKVVEEMGMLTIYLEANVT